MTRVVGEQSLTVIRLIEKHSAVADKKAPIVAILTKDIKFLF